MGAARFRAVDLACKTSEAAVNLSGSVPRTHNLKRFDPPRNRGKRLTKRAR